MSVEVSRSWFVEDGRAESVGCFWLFPEIESKALDLDSAIFSRSVGMSYLLKVAAAWLGLVTEYLVVVGW